MKRVGAFGVALGLLALPATAGAQNAFMWAGANDTPNTLINAAFDGSNMVYGPEVPSGGSTTGGPTTIAFNEVSLRAGGGSACSLIAQTNNGSANVSIYTVDGGGTLTPAAGSPFAGIATVAAVAWAPDGGALYVPASAAGLSQVVTFTVSCTPPSGPVTVVNAGPVTITGFDLIRDAVVVGPGVGSHLCLSAQNTNNVGCVPIDPSTRLPGTTTVNTIPVTSARGMDIASNGCGVVGVGTAPTVAAFSVNGAGTVTAANTAAHLSNPRYGAVSPDGSFAAFGSFGDDIALYTIAPATCNITQVGTNSLGNAAALIEYVTFDEVNRLFVADALINQIRVFQASGGGLGAPLSTTTTSHGTVNPPGGIAAALTSSVPVELQHLGIE